MIPTLGNRIRHTNKHEAVFISKALAQTTYAFPTLDHALKSNVEISSKLDALKRQKIEFE